MELLEVMDGRMGGSGGTSPDNPAASGMEEALSILRRLDGDGVHSSSIPDVLNVLKRRWWGEACDFPTNAKLL